MALSVRVVLMNWKKTKDKGVVADLLKFNGIFFMLTYYVLYNLNFTGHPLVFRLFTTKICLILYN